MQSVRLLFVGFFLFLVTLSSFSFAGPTADPMKSSVWIETIRPNGLIFRGEILPSNVVGMGVVLPSGEVVTAAHVVFGATKISARNVNDLTVVAKIVDIDKNTDIAILDVSGVFKSFAPIRPKAVVSGDGVTAVEQPMSNGAPAVFWGKVETPHSISNGFDVRLIHTSIKGDNGMSGGGLFDEQGNLTGIIVRIYKKPLRYLFALPVAELCTRFSRCATGK